MRKPTAAQVRELARLAQPEAGISFSYMHSHYRHFAGAMPPEQDEFKNRIDPHLFSRLHEAGWIVRVGSQGSIADRTLKVIYRITDAGREAVRPTLKHASGDTKGEANAG